MLPFAIIIIIAAFNVTHTLDGEHFVARRQGRRQAADENFRTKFHCIRLSAVCCHFHEELDSDENE